MTDEARLTRPARWCLSSRRKKAKQTPDASAVALMKRPPVLHKSAAASTKRTGGTPPAPRPTDSSAVALAMIYSPPARVTEYSGAAVRRHLSGRRIVAQAWFHQKEGNR